MTDVDASELRTAVEKMHGCSARPVAAVPVSEAFGGRPVWQGVVHVFDLEGHSTATRTYAWSSPIEGSTKRRFHPVLHVPPVNSAADAVRAAIVADHRSAR